MKREKTGKDLLGMKYEEAGNESAEEDIQCFSEEQHEDPFKRCLRQYTVKPLLILFFHNSPKPMLFLPSKTFVCFDPPERCSTSSPLYSWCLNSKV